MKVLSTDDLCDYHVSTGTPRPWSGLKAFVLLFYLPRVPLSQLFSAKGLSGMCSLLPGLSWLHLKGPPPVAVSHPTLLPPQHFPPSHPSCHLCGEGASPVLIALYPRHGTMPGTEEVLNKQMSRNE